MSAFNITADELTAALRVLHAVYHNEADSDHLVALRYQMTFLVVETDTKPSGDITATPSEADVEVALNVFEEHSDITEMQRAYRTVDLEAQHTNRVLPEPRDWLIEYIDGETGDVLERREMTFSDSEPSKPIIDGTPYDCDRTAWDDQTRRVFVEPATHIEDGFEISCWDCSWTDTADTEAHATQLSMEHNEQHPEHNAGYRRNR